MKYYRVNDGVVCEVRNQPHPECPYSTDQPVECGMVVGNRTDAELAAAQVEVATKAAQVAAIASIYAPVAYLGKDYPVDTESMSKYEIAKQSRTRGKLKKGLAIATDGTILKLTGTAAIDAFHGAMEDAITARVEAVHDAI